MICLPFVLGSTPNAVDQRTAELNFSLFYVFQSLSFMMSGTCPMNIWLYQTLSTIRLICTIEFIDHIQLSTRIMHKKLWEAKLRLVIMTDIKDISPVGQSPKRVTPAQNTKCKCVGYG